MPSEKEELLNAVVCRVDALEAELIATKKALHEALMKQEELLAYIDGQKQAKLRKKKFFSDGAVKEVFFVKRRRDCGLANFVFSQFYVMYKRKNQSCPVNFFL